MPGIFHIQNDGSLVEMSEANYESEDLLQTLLADYPSLLAGDQIQPENPRRWLLIRREMPVPDQLDGGGRWALDHLFFDQDAVPTLIEVNRSTDTRIRRHVVGQMLDYAANAVVYWPVQEFISHFNRECENAGVDPDEQLCRCNGKDSSPDDFWERASTNLQAGKIRMVFVADSIPTELQRIVEFLNEQMSPAEVLAVEIKQFVGQGMKSLVPRLIGQTAEAGTKKRTAKQERVWDEESFFEEYNRLYSPQVTQGCRKLYELLKTRATRVVFGRGNKYGNIMPYYDDERGQQLIFNISTNGTVGVTLRPEHPFPFSEESLRQELIDRLNLVPGISLASENANKYFSINLVDIVEQKGIDQLIEAVEWSILKVIETRNEGSP